MNLAVDVERLTLAHKAVRAELLSERAADGHWRGQLASSPFATAAAVCALVTAHRRESKLALGEIHSANGQVAEQVVQSDLCELLVTSVSWLASNQNPDGGWGDCVGAPSNLTGTMLVQAAFRLTGIPAKYADAMDRADDYVALAGGVSGLRRECGRDRSLLAAILSNCALAGMVPWRQVPTLQFELACLPKRWQNDFSLFGSRQAWPIVLAVGRAKFHHDPPKNPISRLIRRSMRAKSIGILAQLQAADDSFLSSIPATAFVVTSLSSVGSQDHAVVERGIEFLLSSVRADSSWAITPEIAVSNTALAISKLGVRNPVYSDSSSLWSSHDPEHPNADAALLTDSSCEWLLARQRTEINSVTEVAEGGWAATDAPGALPNAVATAEVLLALARSHCEFANGLLDRVDRAAGRGIAWLLNLQNDDGSWPTYYRDEALPRFEEGSIDVTTQVLQCLAAWRREWHANPRELNARRPVGIEVRIVQAIDRGWNYLSSQQRDDGSFVPLWFGNQHQPDNRNPVIGTSLVLSACAELDLKNSELAQRASRWLLAAQHANGGWGPPRAPVDYSVGERDGIGGKRVNETMAQFCTAEETSMAISALLAIADSNPAILQAASRGLAWLVDAVEHDTSARPAIIGFSMAKLWYHERLHPLAFAAGALSRAVQSIAVPTPAETHVGG
jgi:squalene-hopene/tetraprenyl-beta-curcumene cyclase